MFLIDHRIPNPKASARERQSVWLTTLSLLLVAIGMSSLVGFVTYVIVQVTILGVAGGIGVWLFYAQHQFERAYWRRGEDWSFVEAALEGSTFLKLPRLLQWFTGNIGFHHIHHLNSRIPNYRLQACHDSHPMFAQVTPMTIVRSLQAFGLKLFDETSGRLVCFRVIGPRPSRRSPVS
jgi:omega-6 fatty acid desaturase (delta-12 desaturase)